MSGEKYVPLVEVTRGEIVESIHYGAFAVVDSSGNLIAQSGNPDTYTHLRSAAKPFQVLPLVEMGGMERFGLTDRELALMCASHSGTDEQVRVVEGIQKKIGVDESDLLCGTHMPLHKPTAQAMMDRNEVPTPNRNNCSGKHTGMLAQALLLHASKEDYVNPQHKVQKAILQVISEMCDLKPDQVVIGIDGCSAPVFAVPLRSAAYAYARLGDPSKLSAMRTNAIHRIVEAMTGNPYMVAGPDRFDTILMQAGCGQIVTKTGAEGYQGIGIKAGVINEDSQALGICIKIADGDLTGRAIPIVALEILRQLGAFPRENELMLDNFDVHPLNNFSGKRIGEIRTSFLLHSK